MNYSTPRHTMNHDFIRDLRLLLKQYCCEKQGTMTSTRDMLIRLATFGFDEETELENPELREKLNKIIDPTITKAKFDAFCTYLYEDLEVIVKLDKL